MTGHGFSSKLLKRAVPVPKNSFRLEVNSMPAVTSDVRFVRNREVVSRQIDGELIIVPIRRGVGNLNSLYTLNLVGCVLWEYLGEGHTIPEMVQRVCDEFEVSVGEAQNDIQGFLDSLLEEQLVQSVA
jgi:hypothetical protein